MSSAELCKDLGPGTLTGRIIDEKGQSSLYEAGRRSSQFAMSLRQTSSALRTRAKMPSFRRLTVTIFIIAFLTLAYASVPVYRWPRDSPDDTKDPSFQDLLNSVSDDSLHDVLLKVYQKYRHGVFPEDRAAIQAVHEDNAAMATSLVELARRQNPNVTVVTVPASSTATVVVVPTTESATVTQTLDTGTVVAVDTQTTVSPVTTAQPTSPTDTPVQTTAPQANPSSSQASAQSSVNGGGVTTGKTSAASSPPPTTLIKSSSAELTSASSGQDGTSTSAGAAAVTNKSSSTQQIVFTTTLPNGSQSTVTSYTVVPAGEQALTAGVSGSTITGTPSLQNGAVDGTQPRGIGLLGSLAAALLFVVGIL